MMIGRDAEIELVRTVLSTARTGDAGILLVRGDPGIGKTCLLEHCAADAAGFRVVRVRGHEAEQDFPFAAMSMLVGPLTEELAGLAVHQSAALRAALRVGPGTHGDRMATAGALLAVLAAAAERRPLLLAVDDTHLLDRPTLDALVFALRRMQHESLAAVLTARPAVDVDPDVERLLEPFDRLDLTGLDLDSARRLTAHDRTLTEAEWTAAGGNPLALMELTEPQGDVVLDQPLPLHGRLRHAFGRRLDGLGDDSREALVLAAVAGRALEALDDALTSRNLTRAALEKAEEKGLVTLETGAVAFTHPLVRSAVYHAASPTVKRRAHRTLAESYAGRAAPGAVERRAFHLAAATLGPDEEVAAELAVAASGAAGRHSLTTAAALFEKAARLSLPGPARTQRIVQAAVAGQTAGTLDAAGPLLESVMTESEDEDQRTLAAHLNCRIQMWSGRPAAARDQLLTLADGTGTRVPEWSSIMLAQAAVVSIALGEQRMAPAMTARAVEITRALPGGTPLLVLMSHAVALGVTGETAAAREVLDRCAPLLPGQDPLSIDQALTLAALAYAAVEDLTEARRWLDTTVSHARGVGAIGLLPFQLSWLALICWLGGDWITARAHAISAVQVAEQTGWTTELPNCLIALATIEAGYGNEDLAREHARRAEEVGTAQSTTRIFSARAACMHGLLDLAAGRYEAAAAALGEAAEYSRSARMGDYVLYSWAGNLTEALVRAGRTDQARAVHRTLVHEAERNGLPTWGAVAARCGALLAPSAEEAQRLFEEACALHERAAQPFEYARTQLCFGAFLRRRQRGDEARVHLDRARGTFARLGAEVWRQRTHDELVASGDTSSRPAPAVLATLTAQEHQVAVTVAEGVTNREVAARLFLAPKTVEFHLSNVYRKLSIRHRGELIRMLSGGS